MPLSFLCRYVAGGRRGKGGGGRGRDRDRVERNEDERRIMNKRTKK